MKSPLSLTTLAAALITTAALAAPAAAFEAPSKIPEAAAIQPVAAENGVTTIRICAGGRSGAYYPAARIIGALMGPGFEVEAVETGGTWDNILRSQNGECPAIIAQPDGMAVLAASYPAIAGQYVKIGQLHREYAWAVCNRSIFEEETVADVIDAPEFRLVISSNDSGTNLMFANWIEEDGDYALTRVIYGLSQELGLQSVISGQNHCILIASGAGSKLLADMDQRHWQSVRLVEVDDSDFNDAEDLDGSNLYEFVEIDPATFPNLMKRDVDDSRGEEIETVSWRAGVYVNAAYFKGPDGAPAQTALFEALRRAGPAAEAAFSAKLD